MNKKLIKTIASITCGLGVITTIPFASASCGNSSEEKIYALPEDVYQIDANGVLQGFKSGVDLSQYNDGKCDTLLIPTSVTSIANNAFYNGSASTIPSFIKKLTFAEGSQCSSIGEFSFATIDGSSLTSVSFPSSLESIGDSAFYLCKSLTTVNLLNCDNLSSIDDCAFTFCTALTSIDLSHTKITTICHSTFSQCKTLTSVKLPNNLQTIEQAAFTDCNSLASISFPSSLTTISVGNTFSGCTTLNFIAWDLPRNYETSISMDIYTFSHVSSSGSVVSLNPSITSQQLLEFLKTKGNLPEEWKIAEELFK